MFIKKHAQLYNIIFVFTAYRKITFAPFIRKIPARIAQFRNNIRIYSASELDFALKEHYFSMESEKQEYDTIEIITAAITKLEVDTIVNAANFELYFENTY